MDLAAACATVETQHQHSRSLEKDRHAERAHGKRRRVAEKGKSSIAIVPEARIRKHPDEIGSIEPVLDLEHRVAFAESDDLKGEPPVDRVEHRLDLAGMV